MFSYILTALSKVQDYLENRFPKIIPYAMGMFSATLNIITNLFVKQLSIKLQTSQIIFFRSLQLAIFSYILMESTKMQFHYKQPSINRLLIARGVAGFAGVGLAFVGIKFLPLSDASVVMQVYPVITGVLAVFVLGEKYEWSQLVAALVCLIGMLFIAQPPNLFGTNSAIENFDSNMRLFGTAMLLCAGFCAAVVEVLVKKVGSKNKSWSDYFYIWNNCHNTIQCLNSLPRICCSWMVSDLSVTLCRNSKYFITDMS